MNIKEAPQSNSPFRANLLDIYREKREDSSPTIPLFEGAIQKGSLILPYRSPFSLAENRHQRTVIVIQGGATMRIRGQEHFITEGGILVVPSKTNASFPYIQGDFLALSLTTPTSQTLEQDSKQVTDKIKIENSYNLYHSEEKIPFMSTHGSSEDSNFPSEVQEIEVFYPEMVNEGYDLDESQACRLLIYKKETKLDIHTHPFTEHVILGLLGVGIINFEGREYNLTPGGLFVVGPNRVHQLGAGQKREPVENDPEELVNFLGIVVNSLGISPTVDGQPNPKYSLPAEMPHKH